MRRSSSNSKEREEKKLNNIKILYYKIYFNKNQVKRLEYFI
jgi:hypothetical protein